LEFLKIDIQNVFPQLRGSVVDGQWVNDIEPLFKIDLSAIPTLRYDILSMPDNVPATERDAREKERARYKDFITQPYGPDQLIVLEEANPIQTQENIVRSKKGKQMLTILSSEEETDYSVDESSSLNLKRNNPFLDLEAGVSGSESDDEQDDGEGVGSFLVPDHESVPASTQQIGSQLWVDTQKESQVEEFDIDKELEEVYGTGLDEADPVANQENALLYALEHGNPNPTQREERKRKLIDLLESENHMTVKKPWMKKQFNISPMDEQFTQVWNSSMKTKKQRKSTANRAISLLF
jgi:hypothetical protein